MSRSAIRLLRLGASALVLLLALGLVAVLTFTQHRAAAVHPDSEKGTSLDSEKGTSLIFRSTANKPFMVASRTPLAAGPDRAA